MLNLTDLLFILPTSNKWNRRNVRKCFSRRKAWNSVTSRYLTLVVNCTPVLMMRGFCGCVGMHGCFSTTNELKTNDDLMFSLRSSRAAAQVYSRAFQPLAGCDSPVSSTSPYWVRCWWCRRKLFIPVRTTALYCTVGGISLYLLMRWYRRYLTRSSIWGFCSGIGSHS